MPTVDELLKGSAFVIGYDKKGDPIGVVQGPGYNIIEGGEEAVSPVLIDTALMDVVKKHLKLNEGTGIDSFPIEVKTTSFLHIGSKSCHVVIIGGRGVVVCG